MTAINSRLGGIRPVWVIVPDKSTAYINSNKQFWNQAERQFQAPNLLQVLNLLFKTKPLIYTGKRYAFINYRVSDNGEAIRQSLEHP